MATQQELKNKIVEVKAEVTGLKSEVNSLKGNTATLVAEMTAAFSRFLAKLAAGTDSQPEIDELNLLKGEVIGLKDVVADSKAQVESAINQARVEGI